MYKVSKATVIKDGKPVKTYDLNADTDNLDATRAYVKRLYSDEYALGLEVDLQYKTLNK